MKHIGANTTMSMSAQYKSQPHADADREAYVQALTDVTQRGVPLPTVVRELRRAYRENMQTWDGAGWRQVERLRAKR